MGQLKSVCFSSRLVQGSYGPESFLLRLFETAFMVTMFFGLRPGFMFVIRLEM